MKTIAFQNFLKCDRIYKPNEIKEVIETCLPTVNYSYSNKKLKYVSVPCGFDIETSSFFRSTGKKEEKIGIMYVWTFGINGLIIMGRTWQEFVDMIDELTTILNLNTETRILCYVHNLAYEFQFMRKWFVWDKVFALDSRKPIYATTNTGVEFRCSYLLSGYKLQTVAENLRTYQFQKMVGDLDYSKVRNNATPLSKEELNYCINDVKIVMAYIQEKIDNGENYATIPLTKTGYVRKYCKDSCFYQIGIPKNKSYKRVRYKEFINSLTLESEEYMQLKRAFQGGFTHANPFYSGKVIYNVTSIDFASSYPYVMISEMFPMSSAEKIVLTSISEFENSIKHYCCLFDIEIFELESKLYHDNYLSESRCRNVTKAVVNNGRIVSAEHLTTTITEQDYFIIKTYYKWSKIRIRNFKRYKKGYLPTDLIKAILKLFYDKSTLKGIEGKEEEYLNSKELLNSCYGMMVTDIIRDENVYKDDSWNIVTCDNYDRQIEKYNKNAGRFLFYPWGVWVTAYARRNLFTGITSFGEDYVYSDTDSVKVINYENHLSYIEKYNQIVKKKLIKSMNYHKLDISLTEPETKNGKKYLGIWDFDGHYNKFKTLGAKRYLVEYSNDPRNKKSMQGKINLTVSGLNKQICVPWMIDKWGNEIFDHFNDKLYVPPEYTGKNTHTYIDDEKVGFITDYLGNKTSFRELSSIHLCESDYSLSLSREYRDYLAGIQDIEISG